MPMRIKLDYSNIFTMLEKYLSLKNSVDGCHWSRETMRRFKTHSTSSTTPANSRKSSSVSGLFKSASSPTPPTNFRSTESPPTSTTSTSTTSSYHQRSAALFRNYGRALNRSLHSGIGYVSGHNSHSHEDDNEDGGDESSGLLTVDDNHTGATSSTKSPLSPKLPSRFKFSKNKTKSNSCSWYSTSKNRNEFKQGASCPGLLESSGSANNKDGNAESGKRTSTGSSKPSLGKLKSSSSSSTQASSCSKQSRPMLIRQHSDEHQNALIEKVHHESSKPSSAPVGHKDSKSKDKSNKNKTQNEQKSILKHKSNAGKLRKMGALECPVPTDIVYEEGDSNKVLASITVHFYTFTSNYSIPYNQNLTIVFSPSALITFTLTIFSMEP